MTTVSLPYRYEFQSEELVNIVQCNEEHGFAVVKGVLPTGMVEMLKAEVRRVLEDQAISSSEATHYCINFIEESPAMATLMTYEPVMRIARALVQQEPMTLNRSAAIFKKPGSRSMAWHTDVSPQTPPYTTDSILNNTDCYSLWFYLNGIEPIRGGLSIIPDSHTLDWQAPEGFEFTPDQRSFNRKGSEPVAHANMEDVPGAIPVICEPGDLVIFAQRTYHGVYPHRGTENRLSCAFGFRKNSYTPRQLWPLPESAKKFKEFCPQEVKYLVEDYWGLDRNWRGYDDVK